MCLSHKKLFHFGLCRITFCFWIIGGVPFATVGHASDWPIGRGNASSTGVADGKLPDKPAVLWEYKTESDKSGFEGTPIIYDGKVFVGDFEGTVHAIDLITGKAVWTVKKKDGFITAAAAHQDKVVIGDFSGIVFCLDAKTGEQVWSRDIEQQVASGANFYGDDVLLASEAGTMFALDIKTGEIKWSYTTGDQLRSSPTVWKSFSLLGGCDGKLHKIDLVKGEKVGDGVTLNAPTLSTPNIIGKIAIVSTQPGVVLAIDVETEKVVWTFSDSSQSSDMRASPASLGKFENDKLTGISVVATRNRRLLGLDLSNGKVLWESILKKRADGSPIICSDRAWIGALDGSIYAIDLKSGEETWSYQMSGQILASPAVADEKLIIATEKGSVICFGAK
jgi:outer membrane protein assembly factor BamB